MAKAMYNRTMERMAELAQKNNKPFSEIVQEKAKKISYVTCCRILGFSHRNTAMKAYKNLFAKHIKRPFE